MASSDRRLLRVSLLLSIVAVVAFIALYNHHKAAQLGRPLVSDGVPDADLITLNPSGPAPLAPDSPWLKARSRRYAALLGRAPCEVLVVPVQVEGYGFDRPNRALMSLALARALGGAGRCVADPALVDLALGEGQRRRSPDAVLALARAMHASLVVSAFAGHDPTGWMRITLQLSRLDPAHPPQALVPDRATSITGFKYGTDQPPFVAFEEHLGALLDSVGLKAAPPAAGAAGAMPAQLPGSPADFAGAGQGGAVADAARLLFLAMLAPAPDAPAAQRLFTRAWARLQDAAPSADASLLRARILYHLHQRPYAQAQLQSAPPAAAAGLRALLDGNLPQARAALAAAGEPWERFFLAIEVHDLEQRYGRPAAADPLAASFADSPWRVLLEARRGDLDSWSVNDTLPFEALLDRYLPLAGSSASEALLGNAIVSRQAGADQQLLALRHVHRLLEQEAPALCCAALSPAPGPLDLLDVLDSRIEAALVQQSAYLHTPQGDDAGAQEHMRAYDGELAGQPRQEVLRANIAWSQLREAAPQQREALVAQLQQAAWSALGGEQQQSRITRAALWYLEQPPVHPATPALRALGQDYPARDYWDYWSGLALQRLDYSSDNSGPLFDIAGEQPGTDPGLVPSTLQARFRGEPAATEAWLKLVRRHRSVPTVGQVPEALKAAIAADPDNWPLYSGLARAQMQRSEFAAAAATVLAYPEFGKAHPGNTVTLSNYAYDWGNELFWLGAFDAARPLLQRAAGYANGSGASADAAVRLALLDRNFRAAATGELQNARHYNGTGDYGEFLRLLFAAGHEREAWAIFDQITSRQPAPNVVSAALTGNRRRGLSGSALRDWLRTQLPAARAGGNGEPLLRYALAEQLTDRVPDAGFAAFMKDLAGPAEVTVEADGHIYPAQRTRHDTPYLGPSKFGAARHPRVAAAAEVPHRYALAAEAFAQFRAGRYEQAVAAFDQFSAYYYIEGGESGFVLPYFSYAAASTGDKLGLGSHLALVADDDLNFDVLLSRAVFAALAGRHDESARWLDQAYLSWPYDSDYAPLNSGYAYMDLCSMLYAQTREPRYRAAALRLARTLRVVRPTDADAYALIGYLGDGDEQLEALAIALYLDPRSHWASLAPQSLRTRALALARSRRYFELDTAEPAT
jgi:hypothetical protein